MFSENPYLKKTGKDRKKRGQKEGWEGRREGRRKRGRSAGRQAENEIPDLVLCLPHAHAHTHKCGHIEKEYLFFNSITDT